MIRTDILERAEACWTSLADFRRERNRCKRYTYGRQWNDMINVEGRWMQEEDYIRQQGNIPLKNNLIRRIVRNVVGVFRNQHTPPAARELGLPATPEGETAILRLEESGRANCMEELLARTMEEFLISGMAVHRKWFGRRAGRLGAWTDYVHPDYFFIDSTMRDFRGWDASIVGEIHDVTFDELCCRLASPAIDPERLLELYPGAGAVATPSFRPEDTEKMSFHSPASPGLCRVLEVWVKETRPFYRCHDTLTGSLFRIPAAEYAERVEKPNRERVEAAAKPEEARLVKASWKAEEVWRYYFMTTSGEVIAEGDSPYGHGGHPYVFKAYPYIDGEIHSFVADLIDQQRYINRLVTLYDYVMRASAKGVLVFPEEAIPAGMDIDDITSEWSRVNGVLLYRSKNGAPAPHQATCNAANAGVSELLNVQLKMMEDVSGVNPALQGKLESGATSGTLYGQQTRHAIVGLLDILDSFNHFIVDGALKELSLFKK